MQEKVKELASRHAITIEDACKYYLMGGDHADTLCILRENEVPESYIELQNHMIWEKKNQELRKVLLELSK